MNEQLDLKNIIHNHHRFRDALIENQNTIHNAILKSGKPYSGQYLLNFYKKVNAIKDSIIQVLETDNIYPAFILYRSLIEHYFKFYYGYMIFIIEDNDQLGKKFISDLWLAEFLDTEMKNLVIDEILTAAPITGKFEKILLKHPDLGIPSDYTKTKVEEEKEKFSFLSTVEYCLKNKELDDIETEETYRFLIKLLHEYNHYATFVHGGPSTDIITNEIKNDLRNSQEYNSIFSSVYITADLLSFYLRNFLVSIEKGLDKILPVTRRPL